MVTCTSTPTNTLASASESASMDLMTTASASVGAGTLASASVGAGTLASASASSSRAIHTALQSPTSMRGFRRRPFGEIEEGLQCTTDLPAYMRPLTTEVMREPAVRRPLTLGVGIKQPAGETLVVRSIGETGYPESGEWYLRRWLRPRWLPSLP
jgi:hypothetical protein